MGRKIIITVLSKFWNNPQMCTYENDKGYKIKTDWTNEAGMRYLLQAKPDVTDVICFCSKETKTKEYRNRVENIIEDQLGHKITPTIIGYNTDNDIISICDNLPRYFKFSSDDTVCIDTSGGYRSISFAIMYLFRYFEYLGINIESTIYSSQNKIYEISHTFNLFTLINGAHEFTTTGNPKTLKDYFCNSKNKIIVDLLDAMEKFYDEITLCRVGNEMENSLQALKTALEAAESYSPKDFDERRLQDLLHVIREKLFPKGESKYLSLVRWCLENNLMQQAITIYVEKLPKAYFTELNFLKADFDKMSKKSKNLGTDIYSEYFITADSKVSEDEIEYMMNGVKHGKRIKPPKGMEEIYRDICDIRELFYNNYGKLADDYKRWDNRAIELLKKTDVSVEKMPDSFDKLINSKNQIFKNLQSYYSKSMKKKLNGVLSRLTDNEVKVNISPDELKKLRLDFLYMKVVRNTVNHASENEPDDEEFKREFSKCNRDLYVFPQGNNFSVSHIRKVIKNSIEFIEQIEKKNIMEEN